MFERFTERARQVVVLAQEEARTNRVRYIGPEHILVGVLREEEGVGSRVLGALGVNTERVRGLVLEMSEGEVTEEEISGQIPFTPRAKACLELALREALSLGHNYIGTEHILLGLMRESGSKSGADLNKAMSILKKDFRLDAEKIREEVIRMLSGPKAPILDKAQRDEMIQKRREAAPAVKEQELVETAVILGRQFPDRPASAIARAAMALFHA